MNPASGRAGIRRWPRRRILLGPRFLGRLAFAIEEGHDVLHDRPRTFAADRGNEVPAFTPAQLVDDRARDVLLLFLEQQVGVPIRLLGVGPGRDQYVQLSA